MSLNGIWTTQYHDQSGWQNIGVLVFEDGRVLGGGRHHYTRGAYSVSDRRLTLELHVEVHGESQTFFGLRDDSFHVVFEGSLEGDAFDGYAKRPDVSGFALHLRGTRRCGLGG